MRITRIAADGAGESFFEEIDVSLNDGGPLGRMSDPLPVKSMILRENDPGYDYDWHTAPRRQYIVMLEGEVEISTSDGDTRIFGPGEIVLVEDTEGRGHKSRSPSGKPRRSLFLPLP